MMAMGQILPNSTERIRNEIINMHVICRPICGRLRL